MAGVKVTQKQVDEEIAHRIRTLNRTAYELRKIKSTFDRLGDDGLIALQPGGRLVPWDINDVTEVRAAIDGLVAAFDAFSGGNPESTAMLDSMAGFGF
jgi:hypothetical protein